MNKKLLALYGLKWNPFSPDVPIEALYVTPKLEDFFWRIEQTHLSEGGFAMISGEPGTGKSVALRLLADRLDKQPELTVGALEHPQSSLADFYREMGDIFDVPLRPHNRWGGFKALRERWHDHLESTLLRAVLLVDEAQQMCPAVLNELRLLCSTRFDSRSILCVVLAGDQRLADMLRRDDLLPLGSRMRIRLGMDYAGRDELLDCLDHLLDTAGNTSLMTKQLQNTLCDHAVGNYRVLTTMAAELLAAGVKRELAQLDDKLYLDVFGAPRAARPKARRTRATAGSR